jgi:GNAT superfamily N-acetyltransferase
LTESTVTALARLYDTHYLVHDGIAPFTAAPAMTAVLRRLLSDRRTRTFVAQRGGRPAAFAVVQVRGARASVVLHAVDPRGRQGVSEVLLFTMVGHAMAASGVKVLDLGPAATDVPGACAATAPVVHVFSDRRPVLADIVGRTLAHATAAPRIVRMRRRLALLHGRGALELFGIARRIVARWWNSTTCVLLYRLDRGDPIPPLPVGGTITMNEDALEDFLYYTGSNRYVSRQRMIAEAARRLDGGAHCYTTVEHGVLTHYRWFAPQISALYIEEVAFRYPLPPQSGVAYDAYTEPSARGRGLQKVGLRRELEAAFADGIEHAFNYCLESNGPSVKNIEGAGYRRILRIRRLTRMGFTRHVVESL